METKPIIQVRNLTIGYGGNVIQKDISFDVQRGQTFIILGGSGCGKSSLMKNMIGLYEPMQGQVLIDGKDILTAYGTQRKEILRKFGVSYQSGALFGSMTVLENVRLVLEEFTQLPKDAMDFISRTKLKLVDLADACHKMPSELSGGMQKRAAIARATALDPKIIFLDSIYTVANHVIMLDKVTKSIIAQGDPKELRDHSENTWVRQFFNRVPSSKSA